MQRTTATAPIRGMVLNVTSGTTRVHRRRASTTAPATASLDTAATPVCVAVGGQGQRALHRPVPCMARVSMVVFARMRKAYSKPAVIVWGHGQAPTALRATLL